jgi:hypothetical protein
MSRPAVFEPAMLDEAMARATATGRWLFVAATSTSSEPCAVMDRTTWLNERVGEAIAERGVAIQLDVDADRETAERLKVRTVPTLIAFKGGAEKDRLEGFREAAHVLMWLASLERKPTELDRALRAPGSGDLERDMHGRLSFAKTLLREGRHEEATEHYVWLWNNIVRVEPGMSGVRVSFMAGQIEQLVAAHEPARPPFAELREQAAAAAAEDPASIEARLDWVVLNKILGEEERTMSWFDAAKNDPSARPTIDGISRFLSEPLKARGRWADLGRLYHNPLVELAFQHEVTSASMPTMPAVLGSAGFDHLRSFMASRFRTAAAELLGSLRAAGRNEEATAVREEALRLDPSDEMKTALEQAPIRYD